MTNDQRNRVLNRIGARELALQEIPQVSGATFHLTQVISSPQHEIDVVFDGA